MIKILIVDDEVLVRHGLRTIIDWNVHGFEVVGEAVDGEKGLSAALELNPHIVLTDLFMPKMDGFELIKELRIHLPKTKVIVLSCHNDYASVREAMQLWGAMDYIFKLTMQPQEILGALLKVKDIILAEDDIRQKQKTYLFGQYNKNKDIAKAIEFINDFFMEDIKLTDVANHVNLNESYLSSIIKKNTGHNFVEILNEIRITHAKILLETTDNGVNQISEDVGYSSWSYFSQVFKKIVGMSPATYRNKMKSDI